VQTLSLKEGTMGWVTVTRFIKSDRNRDMVEQYLQRNREHWEEVALDVGLDPEKNVQVQENDKEARIDISEEMDQLFREEAGSWKAPEPTV
jgi:1,2-phenylacetyl-CoA epoxidase catalytic subunit